MAPVSELNPPARLLLGPGPSMVSPRVMRTMAAPVLSHLDPDLMAMMDELRGRLTAAFKAPPGSFSSLRSSSDLRVERQTRRAGCRRQQ